MMQSIRKSQQDRGESTDKMHNYSRKLQAPKEKKPAKYCIFDNMLKHPRKNCYDSD